MNRYREDMSKEELLDIISMLEATLNVIDQREYESKHYHSKIREVAKLSLGRIPPLNHGKILSANFKRSYSKGNENAARQIKQ